MQRVEVRQIEFWDCPTCNTRNESVDGILVQNSEGHVECFNCETEFRWTY